MVWIAFKNIGFSIVSLNIFDVVKLFCRNLEGRLVGELRAGLISSTEGAGSLEY